MRPVVAIVGFGHVGRGMRQLFPDARVIDPDKGFGCMGDAAGCDLVIVCVPTPKLASGACDVSIVEQVVGELSQYDSLILVKSTVTPGTCARLSDDHGARVVFSPEYMGESRYWTPPQFPQPRDPMSHGFVILGGARFDCSRVADLLLPVLGPATRFRFMTSTEAELVKYFENAYFALKVTFANEMRRICDASLANYHMVREGWLDDPRVGPMHTAAFKDAPGFDGKCLPKDLAALAHYCRTVGVGSTLLEAVSFTNDQHRHKGTTQ